MNDLGLVDRRLLAVACSHLKFFQDGGGRHLRFVRTGNSAIRCAVPENPTLEPNMGRIGRPVAEIWPFEMLVAFRFAICRFLCNGTINFILLARLQTSPASWAALSLPVPLSADAEGSLGIKPRRDVNAAAHGGGALGTPVVKVNELDET